MLTPSFASGTASLSTPEGSQRKAGGARMESMRSARINDLREEWGLDSADTPRLNEETLESGPRWFFAVCHGFAFQSGEAAPRCPSGCAPRLVRAARPAEIPNLPPPPTSLYRSPTAAEIADAWSAVRRAPDHPPVIDRNGRQHDAQGRFQPDAPRSGSPLGDGEVRLRIRKLWFTAPRGTKSQLARMLGFRVPHALASLRGLVKRQNPMPPGFLHRVARVLIAIERGDIALVATALRHRDGKPAMRWRQIGQLNGISVPQPRRPGRPRKREGGGVAA